MESDFSELNLIPSFIAMTSSDNLQLNWQGFIKIFVATESKWTKKVALWLINCDIFNSVLVQKLKYKAFLMNVSNAWATHQIVATEPESVLVRQWPWTPTQRRPHVDTPGPLSRNGAYTYARENCEDWHSNWKLPSRQCRVRSVHKKWL
jgi:hypothetical protein